MTDLAARLEAALAKAAEYDLLACLSADGEKRAVFRARAKQCQNLADELRALLRSSQQMAGGH